MLEAAEVYQDILEKSEIRGLDKGYAKGKAEGKAEAIIQGLEFKFGFAPANGVKKRIVEEKNLETLAEWYEAVFVAESIDDFRKRTGL